jgi:sulfite exporter TauE/SafE
MKRWPRLFLRLLFALVLAAALLALGSVVSYFALGGLFGWSGHPAGPDLPSGCYTAYAVGAPVVALAAGLWFSFRRRRKPAD